MSGKPSLERVLSLIETKYEATAMALYPVASAITIKPIVSEAIITLDALPHTYATVVSLEGTGWQSFKADSFWLDIQRVTANVNVPDSVTKDFVMGRMGGGFDPGLSSCGDLPYVAEIHSRKVEAAPEYSSFLNDAIKGYCTIDFAIKHGKNETAKALMSLKRPVEGTVVSNYMVDSIWLKGADEDFLSLPLDSVRTLSSSSFEREQHSKFVISVMEGNKDVASWIAEQRAATKVGIVNVQEVRDLFRSGLLSESKINGVFGKVAEHQEEINTAFKNFTGSALPDYAFGELEVTGAASCLDAASSFGEAA